LTSDLEDLPEGTTAEAIHVGVMSGTLDLVQRIYLGLDVRDGVLYFNPTLLDRIDGLSLPMQFRGTPLRVTLEGNALTVTALAEGFSLPVKVGLGDEVHELSPGERCTLTIAARTPAM
jgi:trehalose/maltose hydrolase-like predicted phosphorylase